MRILVYGRSSVPAFTEALALIRAAGEQAVPRDDQSWDPHPSQRERPAPSAVVVLKSRPNARAIAMDYDSRHVEVFPLSDEPTEMELADLRDFLGIVPLFPSEPIDPAGVTSSTENASSEPAPDGAPGGEPSSEPSSEPSTDPPVQAPAAAATVDVPPPADAPPSTNPPVEPPPGTTVEPTPARRRRNAQ